MINQESQILQDAEILLYSTAVEPALFQNSILECSCEIPFHVYASFGKWNFQTVFPNGIWEQEKSVRNFGVLGYVE